MRFPLSLALSTLLVASTTFTWAVARAETVPADQIKDRTEALPERLEKVDVVEHTGAQLPLDLEFVDSTGAVVRLRDYFDGHRPVLLTFNYSDCPMLCSIQLNHLVHGLRGVDKTAGNEFQILTLSIDPKETPERSAESKLRYLGDYGRPEAAKGWHFLTSPTNTRVVADAVGFEYSYNEARKEWLHAATMILATPDGRVARYLYGLDYAPQTLELSLIEASDGKIATTVDQILLYCFHYDATEGRYAPVAMNIMRVAAALTAVTVGFVLFTFWARERRKKNRAARKDTFSPTAAS
jgi:protein SCO1/2